MTKLSEYISITRQSVQEVSGSLQYEMSDDVYTNFIRRAVRRYGIDKPFEKVSAITGTSSKYITINNSNLPGYVDGFSKIEKIEAFSPNISNNERPNYLDRDEWDLYRDESELRIYLLNHQPTASDSSRITYTIPHTINELDSETVDTIPEHDREAIVLYAASQAFMSLAGKFAGTSDPALRSDIVNYKTKSAELRALSKQYMDMYNDWQSDPLKAASLVRDLNFGFGFADNQPFMTHRSFSRN